MVLASVYSWLILTRLFPLAVIIGHVVIILGQITSFILAVLLVEAARHISIYDIVGHLSGTAARYFTVSFAIAAHSSVFPLGKI